MITFLVLTAVFVAVILIDAVVVYRRKKGHF